MENNLDKVGDTIAELAPLLGGATSGSPTEQAKAAIQAVRDLGTRLKEMCGLPTTLREAGVTEDMLESIARAAINDGATIYNPEDITYDVALDILKRAY